jgi:hypothetical protein
MDDRNELLARIEALEEWKRQREQQQITFPLDHVSVEVLQKYFMRILGTVTYTAPSGNEFVNYIGKQDELEFAVARNPYIAYTVNATTNILTLEKGSLADDTQIIFYSEDTLPDPLVSGVTYYVISSSGSTFKVSATLGGSEIDITDTGTGRQYVSFV